MTLINATSLQGLTSGWSLMGTKSFSCRVTTGPRGSGRHKSFLFWWWNNDTLTRLISEKHNQPANIKQCQNQQGMWTWTWTWTWMSGAYQYHLKLARLTPPLWRSALCCLGGGAGGSHDASLWLWVRTLLSELWKLDWFRIIYRQTCPWNRTKYYRDREPDQDWNPHTSWTNSANSSCAFWSVNSWNVSFYTPSCISCRSLQVCTLLLLLLFNSKSTKTAT